MRGVGSGAMLCFATCGKYKFFSGANFKTKKSESCSSVHYVSHGLLLIMCTLCFSVCKYVLVYIMFMCKYVLVYIMFVCKYVLVYIMFMCKDVLVYIMFVCKYVLVYIMQWLRMFICTLCYDYGCPCVHYVIATGAHV